MATRIPTAIRNSTTTVVTTAVDAGPGPGTIEVRTGAQPASANDAASGTLLVTFTLADPAFGAPVTGVADLDATPVISAVAVAAGAAGWFRVKDSSGATVADGKAGVASDVPTPELIFDNALLALGQTVNLIAGTVTTPATTV